MNQHIQVFIPNYPPPMYRLKSSNSSSFSSAAHDSAYATRNVYKTRLSNYLDMRKKQTEKHISKSNTLNTLKLGEVSKELGCCIDLLYEINEKMETLSHMDEETLIDENSWKEHITELNLKITQLTKICTKYENHDVQHFIKNLIGKRQKKRDRIRKRKAETCVLKKYETMRRKKKHHQLDKLLEQNAKEIHQNRQQMENKQRAEQILMDVKNRQSEADKFITLLDSLKELHHIRNRDKHYNAGSNYSEFNQEINELREMWEQCGKQYENEEKKLQAFVNGSEVVAKLWQEVLFGESTKEERAFFIRKKDNRLENLISIRCQWDKCIVPHINPFGSIIPFCWAYPSENPSNKWKEYIKNN